MPGFTWDRRSARFRDSGTGRYIAPADVRQAVDAVASGVADEMAGLAGRFAAGTIDAATFETQARQLLRDSHMAAAAVAAGGRGNMTASHIGKVGGRLRSEYEYLYFFTRAVERGDYSPAEAASIARMYGNGITRSYEAARRTEMTTAGYTWEKRVIGSTVSCGECLDYAGRGWRPIGTLPATGQDCSCRSNCKCTFVYSKKKPS